MVVGRFLAVHAERRSGAGREPRGRLGPGGPVLLPGQPALLREEVLPNGVRTAPKQQTMARRR